MSAVWLTFAAVLCLLSAAEGNNIVWKKVGEDVTIACRTSQEQNHMFLKRGLHEETVLFYADKNSTTSKIEPANKIQTRGKFPNITFTIKNLTSTDIGPHWCLFTHYDKNFKGTTDKKYGSILLVIKEDDFKVDCSPNTPMYLIAIVVSATVLITLVFTIILTRFVKLKGLKNQTQRRPTNDVYEDMRATIRR
ncbi:uncharacterized protein si:ch211-188c18.1 isoform X2 [Oryzias melastigma]|uniref:uncharacterized protein si:ch211-188c18.1 isoform X2 n=1 Tax=Oryzias melastigma TaxID=30732 RepID=UPI00168CDA5A|nr:uncharacterized protein si:ch211-188c18.1 isoform X2 [Oryzias melastigma]